MTIGYVGYRGDSGIGGVQLMGFHCTWKIYNQMDFHCSNISLKWYNFLEIRSLCKFIELHIVCLSPFEIVLVGLSLFNTIQTTTASGIPSVNLLECSPFWVGIFIILTKKTTVFTVEMCVLMAKH